ncbi:lasso peptide biosynthesis B2 protein [Sporosarcina sp. G11-34]|uniref:lasso peptide biosynthesis B2 protein n=1 Tax=Sporosarcina sp. G11-34 TaxID=2849605 RepID=UPI0022A8D5E5|nr:lasso peptide biosynthesis B2 protein [Sporosarcina sp. G11-34]MCZ2257317.1 lasso peptide biosynthesis B2 protein [Sporosarcina sp. G11-34]
MSILKSVRTFLRLNMKTKLLLIEAYFHLGRARYLKSIPFSKLAPSLGEEMKETSFSPIPSNKGELARISKAIHLMSRYTLWESQCLTKAIAGMKMLEKRNIESTLYLGTAKDEKGAFIAHAWLRSGSFYVSGAEVMDRFTVVAKFAKETNRNRLEE